MLKIIAIATCCSLALSGFGQDIQFEAVNKLPAFINTGCEEIMPLVSTDGKSLYFARAACNVNTGGEGAGSDIWQSEFNTQTKEWSRPRNTVSVFNDKGHNAVVGISADGQTIYQLNTSAGRRIKGVYFSKKSNDKWSQPELEPIDFLETEEYFGLYVSPDFKTIVASMKSEDGAGEEDLYVSRKNGAGVWSKPLNLGSVINTIGFEISPFLTPDTKRIYFASNGHRGLGGSDIFYSDRLDESWTQWSKPVNLGSVINTEGFDAYFSMNDSVAWFSSSSGVSSDIYRAKVRKPVDPARIQVSDIVAEASSMLSDLTDDTYDSLEAYTKSVFVTFEKGTAILSADAVNQLDDAVDLIRKSGQGKLTLVAYSNSAETGSLWDKRLDEIRTYLRRKSGLDLMIDHEIIRVDVSDSARKGSVVEVRYN